MRYFMIIMLCLLPSFAHAESDGINSQTTVINKNTDNANDGATQGQGLGAQSTGTKTLKLKNSGLKPNANAAKLHNLEVSMKALKQKMDSINGLEQEQQVRLQPMQDLLQKMMALLSSMQE